MNKSLCAPKGHIVTLKWQFPPFSDSKALHNLDKNARLMLNNTTDAREVGEMEKGVEI